MSGLTRPVDDAVATSVPLCVDLGDALVSGQPASEARLARIRQAPRDLFRGRARNDPGVESGRAPAVDVEHLPYNRALLDLLVAEKAAGRRLVLVADTDEATACAIAGHLRIFDEVVRVGNGRGGSEGARVLESRFPDGFEFIGSPRRLLQFGGRATRTRVAPAAYPRPDLRLILQAIRAHQWLKNALIFLPVLAGQQFTDGATVGRAVLAMIAFSLAASSVYVVNDLLDLPDDRRHVRKRYRPFASGRLPLLWAPFLVSGMLMGAALISAILLPPAFSLVLAVYLLLTFAYSLKLKGTALIDVFTLAALYTLRVLAGSAATGIEPSVWLLGFCIFFFLSLALVKRYAELHSVLSIDPTMSRLPGRSYRPGDLPVLVALGVAAGCMSVLVLALYIISDDFARHYTKAFLLWQLCPLTLYWIGRAWLVVARDEMHDDPLVWAVKDQLSRWVGVAALVILILAR